MSFASEPFNSPIVPTARALGEIVVREHHLQLLF
jgi:hypothetical protein